MNTKLLTVIIVVLGIALTFFALVPMGVIALATWIYLGVMVRKRKTSMFHDQMEPEIAERHLKKLKTSLIVSGVSFPVSIACIILHNVLSGLSDIEEPISLLIGVGALWVFIITTAFGLVIFLRGKQKPILK